ncbi:medium-chain fatty acid-CoA ligase faa2 [Coemansia aciculifera]|uniref:Medium-chain fatty acid-CoA ligase faa2 n=1 Tax=Coemansia aciculifera TaxID=417176 RepID=A0ACC1M9A5_9FUNG|nr:medium-chain fatty acid-CoA ligase faa2 [Coemansia aciculifera]
MSFKVPSSEVPGYSAIYRNGQYKDGTQGTEFAHITTAHELFLHHLALAPKSEFLGTRQFNPADESFGAYEWTTTTDAAEYIENFGSGLDHVFAKHAPDSQGAAGQQPVGVYSINRSEWLLAEFSAFRSRRYTVGICDNVGVECADYVINHSGVSVVICSIDKIPRMLDRTAITPGLRVVISMDRLDCSKVNSVTQAFCAETAGVALRKRAKELGITLLDMDEVVEMGRAAPTVAQPPKPEDICTVCYSSGTTGAQKGVLYCHSGYIHAARGLHLSLRHSNSTYLSSIPLAHCMDRYAICMLMFGGVRVGFFNGDYTRMADDMRALQPTVIFTIPLTLNVLYERMAKATIGAGGIKGLLSRFAYRSKQKHLASTGKLDHWLWDRLVFSKLAAMIGGRTKAILSGAMHLNTEVNDFLRIAMSCKVVQGYGLTETMASGTGQHINDLTSGHIGVPSPGTDIRLRSKPELGYLVTDTPCPRGELMLRSKSLFVEYLKAPEKTRKAMDGEWLATGDIVQINPTGTISFISRANNHFKTCLGTWISPERLEDVYSQHPLVKTTFVHGHSDYYKIVGVVVPDAAEFLPWARAVAELPSASLEELCANAAVVQAFLQTLVMHAESAGISVHEQLGAIFIEPTPFMEKGCGLYTSTRKLKRKEVIKLYEVQLQKLFTEANECKTSKN